MKTMLKVSVIIPVYNAEKYLQQCIDSVCAQTLSEIEIILINDGSTDSSGQIADRAAGRDSRIRVVHQANAHVRVTRNVGISLVRGDYFTFVDADDWIEPDMLSALYTTICSNALDMVVVGATVEYTKEQRSVLLGVSEYVEADTLQGRSMLYERLKSEKLFDYLWNKLYSTHLLREHDLSFKIEPPFEDESFNMHYYMRCTRIGIMPGNPYHYQRNDEDSIVASYKADYLMSYKAKVKLYRQFFNHLQMDADWATCFLQTNTLGSYCVYVQSLYKQNARLGRKQRLDILRGSVFSDTSFMEVAKAVRPINLYEKIFRSLLVYTSPSTADCVYSFLFFMRRNCEGIYQSIRKKNIR